MDELTRKRFKQRASLIARGLSDFDKAKQALAQAVTLMELGLKASIDDLQRIIPADDGQQVELEQLEEAIDQIVVDFEKGQLALDATMQAFSDVATSIQTIVESDPPASNP